MKKQTFILGSCLAATIPKALAQDVLTTPPLLPATPQTVQAAQASDSMQVFAPATPTLPTPFRWGQVNLRPHMDYQFLYGNGLQTSPGSRRDSIVQTLSPGLLLDLGAYWTLDYTPAFTFYSSSAFKNTINHHVSLGWGSSYNDWFFSGSQSCAITSSPEVQTAAQTDRQSYSTALNASYQFNDKWSADLGANQNLNYVSYSGSVTNSNLNLGNSQSWSTMDWLSYQFAPRLNTGVGLGFGYNGQQNSPNSVFEQYQGRVNWRATDKISFQLSGGLQTQQYLSGDANSLISPIFSGSIQYQPFEQTRLSASASQTISPSSYQNQTTENTSASLNLNQRLLGHLFLDLTGGYSHAQYKASVIGLSTARNDDTYTFNARVSCPVLKRGSIAVFYTYSDNSSSQSGFATGANAYGYTSNQIGFDLSYRY